MRRPSGSARRSAGAVPRRAVTWPAALMSCRPDRRHQRGAAGARADVAVAAGDLDHRPPVRQRAGDHQQAPAGGAAEPARDAVDGARGDERDQPAAVLRGRQRRAGVLVDEREPHVRRRPGEQVALDHVRAAVAGQQQAAAAALGEVHGQRGGGADGGVERLGRLRRARVEHDQRPRVGLGDQLALHQPGAAGEGRPVDARGGRALAVRAQAVDLGLGGGGQRGAGVRVLGVLPARRGGDREDAREHEQLVGLAAGDHALGEPERVAQHERGRRQHAPAAAAEGDLDAHARASGARR